TRRRRKRKSPWKGKPSTPFFHDLHPGPRTNVRGPLRFSQSRPWTGEGAWITIPRCSNPPRGQAVDRLGPPSKPKESFMMLMRRCVVLALAACAAFVSPYFVGAQDTKPAHAAVNPAARKDKWWVNLHDGFVERAKKGDVDVLFLGDSITQGWGGAKEVWEKSFGPLKPANFGIGGDQTQHVLWRITEGKELEGIQPKAIV